MDYSKKLKLQWALGRYLMEHTGVPAIMYAAEMVQIRQCYTDYLLKDKVRSILEWIHEEMPASAVNPGRHRWGYFRVPRAELETMPSYTSFTEEEPEPRHPRHRRSFSEPRTLPPPAHRGFDAKVTVTSARRTVNLKLATTAIQTHVRHVGDVRAAPVIVVVSDVGGGDAAAPTTKPMKVGKLYLGDVCQLLSESVIVEGFTLLCCGRDGGTN